MITENQIWELLSEVPDPEIPLINVVEMGIVRAVKTGPGGVEITITPTYSGCPAMHAIEQDIKEKLKKGNLATFSVKTVLSPAWTTDWLSEEAKEKLRKSGIAPPEKTSLNKGLLSGKTKDIACPHCGSSNSEMISQFGSTACKALYKCWDCKEPFEYFKCI
ncbi:MAG: phenylacetate-CoA oxygenase subunit PaaJ [Crocinitomicaceae bacterium]|nr:phenylacetate-CoA oxygenase subunit PaaJ [Crocinitomicaceae bacterium]